MGSERGWAYQPHMGNISAKCQEVSKASNVSLPFITKGQLSRWSRWSARRRYGRQSVYPEVRSTHDPLTYRSPNSDGVLHFLNLPAKSTTAISNSEKPRVPKLLSLEVRLQSGHATRSHLATGEAVSTLTGRSGTWPHAAQMQNVGVKRH